MLIIKLYAYFLLLFCEFIEDRDYEIFWFFDLAVVSNKNFTINNIKDQDLLNKLPFLFRTLGKKGLTEEKLEKIITIVKGKVSE